LQWLSSSLAAVAAIAFGAVIDHEISKSARYLDNTFGGRRVTLRPFPAIGSVRGSASARSCRLQAEAGWQWLDLVKADALMAVRRKDQVCFLQLGVVV
jgi:hypothetical protein